MPYLDRASNQYLRAANNQSRIKRSALCRQRDVIRSAAFPADRPAPRVAPE